jgi:hypothetical protein
MNQPVASVYEGEHRRKSCAVMCLADILDAASLGWSQVRLLVLLINCERHATPTTPTSEVWSQPNIVPLQQSGDGLRHVL